MMSPLHSAMGGGIGRNGHRSRGRGRYGYGYGGEATDRRITLRGPVRITVETV
jgi:hypothetical protein